MHIVLVEPEIPQNTGSIARLCAATASELHLVGRLGFSLEDRYLKRAGLDYWPHVRLTVHASWDEFLTARNPGRLLGFSAHGRDPYTAIRFAADDALVFGGESTGLPEPVRARLAPLYRIPIDTSAVRSLNLANAASIVLYEGLRQLGRLG
jgi:tRNA (cytidine/uridine-2'-O-)-methyltransferase